MTVAMQRNGFCGKDAVLRMTIMVSESRSSHHLQRILSDLEFYISLYCEILN